tara:strand:+ start:1844 stop:2089 length:246 start_codon:yes stop_codon:yes gene_type:complete
MGTPVFGLIEELEIDKSIGRIQNRIESKIFMVACIFISLLKLFNIITFYQFSCLFLFYMFWLNCCILFNISDYKNIEKKIV